MIREDIKKILDMTRSGSITDDQAAELLTALSESKETHEQTSRSEGNNETSTPKSEDFFGLNLGHLDDVVNTFINKALKAVKSTRINVSAKDKDNNLINMSRFSPPEGEDFTFSDNQIQVSSVNGLQLNHSRLIETHFQACHVDGIDAVSSDIEDCRINGSSIDHLTIKNSKICDTEINGSKFSDLSLSDGSSISDAKFNGAIVKTLALTNHSEITDTKFSGVSFANLTLDGSRFDDCNLNAVKCNDTHLTQVHFSDCNFRDCKFVNSSLEGIDLKDLNIRGLQLVNAKVTGNDEFMKIAQEQNSI
jgi:uncharacterized protein YjbI with pentapeptide repeats